MPSPALTLTGGTGSPRVSIWDLVGGGVAESLLGPSGALAPPALDMRRPLEAHTLPLTGLVRAGLCLPCHVPPWANGLRLPQSEFWM